MKNKYLVVVLIVLVLLLLFLTVRGLWRPKPESASDRLVVPAFKGLSLPKAEKKLPQVLSLIRKDDHTSDLAAYDMARLAKEFKGVVVIKSVDVDKNPEMATFFGIETIPAQIFIDREGRIVSKHEGYLEEREVKARIEMIK